jgi:hypothetical protein
MIEVLKPNPAVPSEHRIAAVIEEFGAWRVLAMALRALAGRERARRVGDARALPAHLQRDIGLPPEIEVPRAWEMWR